MDEQRYQIIYLSRDDDIAIMRDWLERTQADLVILVIPPRNRDLQKLVNLKLLARHARNNSLSVGLVTNDPQTIDLCRGIDLETFSSVKRAQKSRWFSEVVDQAETETVGSQDEVEGESIEGVGGKGKDLPGRPLEPVARPRRLPIFRPQSDRKGDDSPGIGRRLLGAVGFLIILLLLAGVLAAVVALVYPTGNIELEPAVRSVSAELDIQANPEAERIDYATLDIPARLTQVELKYVGEMPPSSTSDVPTDKAAGSVTFVNRTDQLVTIPMSITLATSSGANVQFLTTATATVSSTVTSALAPVVAVAPGPTGNVAAGQINQVLDPVLSRQVSVINEAETAGGGVAAAGVVTRVDKDRLWSMVLQQLNQEGYDQLVTELGEQEFIPPESILVLPLDFAYDPSLDGEETDMLSLQMRAVVRGTAIGGQDANQLALAALQAQVPDDYRLDPLSLEFQAGQVVGISEDQAVSFKVQAQGTARAQVDGGEVASMVRGLPIERAQRLLLQRLPLAGEPDIVVEPDWLGRLPWFPFRIEVIVVE